MCKFNPKNDSRRIDPCMKIYVDFINKTSLAKTIMCCCGHGKYKPSMIVKLENYPFKDKPYMEIFSGIYLPKKRYYYKKDKDGVYYIPEVIGK